MLNVQTMKATAKKEKIKVKSNGKKNDATKYAEALRAKFSKMKDDDLAECENCDEKSPDKYEACAFCGNDGDVDKDAKRPDPKTLAKKEELLGVLKKAVDRIKTLARELAINAWDIGRELKTVHSTEAWKARGYKNFQTWVREEIGMSSMAAWNLIQAAQEFTRDQVAEIGHTKLALISRLPEKKDREALMKKARSGAKAKDLALEVSKRRQARGESQTGKPGPRLGKPQRKKGASVSVALKLDARPRELSLLSDEKPKDGGRYKKLMAYRKGAWAMTDIGGGVQLHVSFVHSSKKNQPAGVRIKFVRPE